jgi:hypothetical protein
VVNRNRPSRSDHQREPSHADFGVSPGVSCRNGFSPKVLAGYQIPILRTMLSCLLAAGLCTFDQCSEGEAAHSARADFFAWITASLTPSFIRDRPSHAI